jgi:hypothetical protein
MSLSYLCDDWHKQAVTHIWESRQFKSMYTLQEKARPTRHTLSTPNPRMVYDHTYLTWSTYINLLYIHQQIWTDPLHPRRRAPDTILSTPADRSVGPYPASLPQQPIEQWGKVKLLLTTNYYAYRAHITDMRSVHSILARVDQSIGP